MKALNLRKVLSLPLIGVSVVVAITAISGALYFGSAISNDAHAIRQMIDPTGFRRR